jgi:cytochrome c oxidase assembly protein subunit 15
MDRFARFAWITLGYNILVILWGAAVRATGSGAGCGSHWPLCNGQIVPRSPGFQTIVELTHRLTSGIALLLVVALVIWAFRRRPEGHAARRAAVFSLLFMLSEAAVGAGLVLFELVADNQSMARALFMSTHLVNTFFLLGALTLTAHFASGRHPFRLRGSGILGRWCVGSLVALLLAGVSGAVAALGDTLFPAVSLAEALRQDLSPTAHVLIRLRVLHPVLSIAAAALLILLALRIDSLRPGSTAARWANRWMMRLVFVQLVAGVVNVILLAPVWMQIVHLLLADLLWISFFLTGAQALSGREGLDLRGIKVGRGFRSFRGIDLPGVDLRGADLSRQDFSGACFEEADLGSANLEEAGLEHADLSRARLAGANLRNARLTGAVLTGTDLRGTDLGGAVLGRAGVGAAKLDGARLAWDSRELISEILAQAAGEDVDRLKVAGLFALEGWRRLGQLAEAERRWIGEALRPWTEVDGTEPPGELLQILARTDGAEGTRRAV